MKEYLCTECDKVFPKMEIPIRNKDMVPVCPDCGTPVDCIEINESLIPEESKNLPF